MLRRAGPFLLPVSRTESARGECLLPTQFRRFSWPIADIRCGARLSSMNPLLIFALITGPMTALLTWVIVCELRGVPAFPDAPPPAPGELDATGRWTLGGICLLLAGVAYSAGGLLAVLATASAIAALAASVATIWTLGQSARRRFRRGYPNKEAALAPILIGPFHRRFAQNFRRTIIELPLFVAAYF